MKPTSLVMLLLVALLSLTMATDEAAVATYNTRMLRVQETTNSTTSTGSTSGGSLAAGEATKGTTTEAAATHETKGPTTASFTGPLIAGALAIVLIGGVVKFRNRQAASAN